MSIRKILSLCLALTLALGCFGALAEEDLQVQLDAANARIAELQAQVDTYYPYYEAQIVATFDPDGIIWLKDVQAQYDMVSAQYQSMGLDLAAYGMEESVKRDIVDSAVENNLLLAKAAELGLDQFDEAQLEKIEADADAEMDQYIESYLNYFHADEEVTDELREEAEQYWFNNGVKREDVLEASRKSAAAQAARDYATRDVEVTEEDVQAAYEAMIAENQQSYANDRTYNSDRNSGVAIAWNPEGYRAVKHVLVKFSDEQAQLYSDLQSQLDSLNAEKESAQNPDEPEATDAAEDAEDAEPTPEPRTVSEIDTDIAACATEVEALYAELMPTAREVIDAFNAGTSFDELIEKYNGDPGMQEEPTATIGYAVSANSTTWEQAFTDGAMSIANVGEISEPVYGSNGIHIIYYMSDITPGNVPLDEIRDSAIERADQEKNDAAYDEQLAKWMEEAHVVYHYENFGITPDETAEDEAKDEAAEELIEEAEDEPIEEVAEEEIEQEEAAEAEAAEEPAPAEEAPEAAEEPEATETEEVVEPEAPAEEAEAAETEAVVEAEAPAEEPTEAAE